MDILNFATTLNSLNSSKSSSSDFTPTFTKSFKASWEIDVSVNFGLKVVDLFAYNSPPLAYGCYL
jgi:hypothetical protein